MTATELPEPAAVAAAADPADTEDDLIEATASAGAGAADEVEVEVAGPSLSPSRASDFMACPLLYRFRVIDRLPEAPSPAATQGTVVHAVLERLFDLPAPERTLDRAGALLAPQWERLLAEEPELSALLDPVPADPGDPSSPAQPTAEPSGGLPGFLSGAPALLARYFELEDPQRLEPAERELRVEVQLESGLVLRGFVDRLDVAPSGDMRVVDYKTGRAPGVGFEAKAMFQMRFYALVLWRAYGRVPRLLQLLYLGSGEVLRYEPDEADLRATEVKVKALWDAIARATESGDWRPNPSRLCGWCHHREAHCPAWGGQPPPLPPRPGTIALTAVPASAPARPEAAFTSAQSPLEPRPVPGSAAGM
jgi:putative RecB family exonuclease